MLGNSLPQMYFTGTVSACCILALEDRRGALLSFARRLQACETTGQAVGEMLLLSVSARRDGRRSACIVMCSCIMALKPFLYYSFTFHTKLHHAD